ncbi:Cna B-type domain-containing protein, partial [uncultured Methanobrevibacter sp.]|uniref:Cna B-type domain-containing protein n=1 Tax=uncultured Methanobrevibacter sp. TaxID=253161 RepID=UPI0025D2AB44
DEEEFEHYANYTKSVSGYTITNTHEIELTSVTVSKVWEDKGDFYGKRPSDVTINVFQNGEIVNSIVLNKDNGWKFELKNLPKYDNGKLINYSIDEVNITYYHYKIEENGDYSFTVTNTLNKVHVLKWSWKLIAKKESNKGNFSDKNKLGNGKKIGKYQSKNVISNKNKKSSSWDKNQRKHSGRYFDSGQEFKLFIFLYNQYFFGNMTYEDFVAVLKENGIELEESNNWDSNGTLEFDYDKIEDVPDSIELSDKGNHFEDSSDKIDKDKPASDSGEIDSGEVEVEEVYVEE